MQKTITKLWLVMTLGILCVFCFCGFAKLAHDDSFKALKSIEEIEKRFEIFSKSNEDMISRLTKLEDSMDEIRRLISASSAQLGEASIEVASRRVEPEKLSEAIEVKDQKNGPEIHSDLNLRELNVSKLPEVFPGLGVNKTMDEVLLDFRESLDEEAEVELEHRVELKLQGNMQRGLEMAAKRSQMTPKQMEQIRQAFEMMPQEEMDFFKEAQEQAVLMEMMLENAQPTIEASQRLLEQYDIGEVRQRALERIKSKKGL